MKKYFEGLECVNVLEPRCYFVPFAKEQNPVFERESSKEFTSLNGTWGIREYKSFFDVPEDFYNKNFKMIASSNSFNSCKPPVI